MPVTGVFWPGSSAQDIHLVPGVVGPRLDHLLMIAHTAGNRRADDPPAGVVVTFAANFAPGPGTAGVAVNAQGEVTVTAPLPSAPRLLNFLVVATVREGAAPPFTAYKRFYVHAAITQMWLTPATLTVRLAARRMRFTLLAEFDDGLYGDLTPWCPTDAGAAAGRASVRRVGSDDPAIVWTTNAVGTVGVDEGTGLLTGAAEAGNATITAALRPLPSPPATTAAGTAQAARPWNDPVTLTPINGPGFGAMATTANILILPDGFIATERPEFERLAADLVHKLRVKRRTRPFSLLRDRLNYFMAWVPSPKGGISALEQIRRIPVEGPLAEAIELDTAVAPDAIANAWLVAAPAATNDQYLLNECDTAFAVGLGERPAAQRRWQMRAPHFHPSRFDEQDFDDFLGALRDAAGVAVGGRWARGGDDDDYIFVLSRSNRHGGANTHRLRRSPDQAPTGRYLMMTLGGEDRHRIEDAPGMLGKDMRPDAFPEEFDEYTTAAHELGHSMTLEDEYGYGGGGILPPTRVAELAAWANAQPRSALLSGFGNLDADLVKWRWPRIQKAGVLAVPPQGALDAFFRVQLVADHAKLFAVGDIVRFRLRPLMSAPEPTDRFIVVAVVAPELVVEPLTAAAFDPTEFPPGTALISPTRAPDPDPANRVFGEDLELMHASIRARINGTRNPLNARAGDAPNRPCAGPWDTPTHAINFPGNPPTAPKPPQHSYLIVGLYENAARFDCDVYRPTGLCMMRTEGPETVRSFASDTASQSSQFCPVCRYAMVDLIDPSQHGAIDKDYAPRYPT